MVELEKSKSGYYTLKYNNKYIHSKYDPIGESKRFVEANKQLIKENVVVIGLGLGYHIEEMLRISEGKSKIFVFEGSEEVIAYCETINLKLFNNKNIEIIGPKDKEFKMKLSEKLGFVEDIIIHTSSLEAFKESYEKIYFMLKDYKLSKYTIDKNSELLTDNYKENLKKSYGPIKKLIELFKNNPKTYLIASAGPSLDDEIDLLRENRNKFIIICVGSALKTLMKNSIKPDIIVIIDGNELVYNQFIGYENEDIPLCFLSTACKKVIDNYKGPKYMFYNSMEEDNIIITTGRTVAVASMDIAIKCGASEIVLLGQDLAYIGEKSHTSTYEEIYNIKDNYKEKYKTRRVKSVNGQYIDTIEMFLKFKRNIESLIEKNKNTAFINCSKGAYIEGAEHTEFYTYLKEYDTEDGRKR